MSFTINKKTTGTIRALTHKAKVPFAMTASTGLSQSIVYTSGWTDAYDYDTMRGFVYISGSHTVVEPIGGTFEIQQSVGTGSAYITGSEYSIGNGMAITFEETLYARYARLRFTNSDASGSSANTTGSFIVNSYLIP